MIRFVLGFFGEIFHLLFAGLVTAGLTLGGVFWVYSEGLPNHETLSNYAPPTISRIYSGEGVVIDEFRDENRLFVPIEDIPDLVKNAFVSAEDKNFFQHEGYDIVGIGSALRDLVVSRGQNLRGASTITMQVTRNFLLSADREIERKVQELILAQRVETALEKQQILELYLNEIFLGQNSYGVAAAAREYFNKDLGELASHEAAMLASMPRAPSNLHPVRNHDRLLRTRNDVLREMYENGYIDRATYDAGREMPIRTVQGGDFDTFPRPPRSYFTDEIRRQLTREYGDGEFTTGGFSVRATLDPQLQNSAEKALQRALWSYHRGQGIWFGSGVTLDEATLGSEATWREALAEVRLARDIDDWHLAVALDANGRALRVGIEGVAEPEDGNWVSGDDMVWVQQAGGPGQIVPRGAVVWVTETSNGWSLREVPDVQGAFMAMDVETGRVLAMQGGFSYQASELNRATQAFRQPGSSFKPFVYAAALDSGYTPATIIVDAPIEINTPQGLWRPRNASNRYYGPTPLRTGIERSRNLMTIRLAQEVGMDVVAGYAERFGVYDQMRQFLANSLGSEETTLFRMVAAYSMFANGGERVDPTLVDRVQDRFGQTVYRHDQRICEACENPVLPDGQAPLIISRRERVIDAITAYQITSMMRGVVERGTAAKTVNLPVPAAGKTGTTNEARDVWFVGFTSRIAAGCYIGYDQPQPMGRGASGGGMCGPVFNSFMRDANERYPGTAFRIPPGGYFVKIDRFTGARLPDDATGPNVVREYFREGVTPEFGVTRDGGFAMGQNLPLFNQTRQPTREMTTSTGRRVQVGPRANAGTLSSGGLY